MDLLFLFTGLVCGVLVPVLNGSLLGTKGVIFWIIMVLFFAFVLAYVVLGYAKSKCAKINYIAANKIVAWNTGETGKKKSLVPAGTVCIVSGTALGVYFIVSGAGYLTALLGALSLCFVLFGWYLVGQKRIKNKLNEYPDFLLSHGGMIFKGKAELFDGATRGILDAKTENNSLCLDILRKKERERISLPIPEENRAETEDFIKDMKEFFNGEA